MKQYMEKLGVTGAARQEPSAGDGGQVMNEMNELNERYMTLVTQLHQRLTHIKKIYDDAGIYFPVSYSSCQSYILLLLLLMMTCAPRRHNMRLVSATNLPGNNERVDRGSCSAVPKISKWACRLPGQSSQCSMICSASSLRVD